VEGRLVVASSREGRICAFDAAAKYCRLPLGFALFDGGALELGLKQCSDRPAANSVGLTGHLLASEYVQSVIPDDFK
jgi:hypothetical protein